MHLLSAGITVVTGDFPCPALFLELLFTYSVISANSFPSFGFSSFNFLKRNSLFHPPEVLF